MKKSGDWAPLMHRIRAGDRTAVAELYDLSSHLVFGLARRILTDGALAEDVVVQVFAHAWRRADTYDAERGTVVSWLLTLTRSRAIDVLRGRSRDHASEPLTAASDVPATGLGPEGTTPAVERSRLSVPP